MSSELRVLFLGNHTVGVRTMHVLSREAKLVGVVAHPEDPEDGVRYESVFSAAQALGVPVLRVSGKSTELEPFLFKVKPDLLWIADYRYLLPESILKLSPMGAVNLHPSLLPKYRGRAPINWAILNGETEIGLTAHFVDLGMDTGDIIAQERICLSRYEDVGVALARLYPLYESVTSNVIAGLRDSTIVRKTQDHSNSTSFPARKPQDGQINWTTEAEGIHNLIRAVAPPYPGAFTFLGGDKIQILRSKPSMADSCRPPGTILECSNDGVLVACGKGSLLIIEMKYSVRIFNKIQEGSKFLWKEMP